MNKKYVITENQLKLIKESLDIEDVKLPEFISNSVKEHKTSLGDHPSFPPENETRFEIKILKKRYYELLTNIKKIDGINGDISNKNLINKLRELTIKCKEIEKPIREELEKICFNYVIELFNLLPDDIDITCNLKDNILIKQPITPIEMEENFEDISYIENLNDEILKRRLIDSIILGASTRLSSNYEKILTKIFTLNHNLPVLYNDIIAINEYLSFVKEQKPTEYNIGGEVSVDISSEDTKIQSEGIILPVLIFETIKGIMELISSNGLPENRKDAEYVIGKADFLLATNWDKRLGVGLWDIIMDTIGYDNFNLLPSVFTELVSTPVKEFNYNIREIFGGTKKGKLYIKNIINDIHKSQEFTEIESKIHCETNNEFFTPEELINQNINETDTYSTGEYGYDVPVFSDPETSNHKNIIARSIKDGLTEDKDYYNFFDTMIDMVNNILYEFSQDKNRGIKQKKWNLIPFEQYRTAIIEFMRYGKFMRFPTKYIDKWAAICTNNVLEINAMTDLGGHSQEFPYEEVLYFFGIDEENEKYDEFYNNFDKTAGLLDNAGFYDWCMLPDGSDALSDYGLEPLMKLISELEECETPEQKIVVINKILDVTHTRGDLSSAFIEGGKNSLGQIG